MTKALYRKWDFWLASLQNWGVNRVGGGVGSVERELER